MDWAMPWGISPPYLIELVLFLVIVLIFVAPRFLSLSSINIPPNSSGDTVNSEPLYQRDLDVIALHLSSTGQTSAVYLQDQ